MFYNTISSFSACATAGFLNAFFMRQTELRKGIDVVDPASGESVGKSKKAAMKAVTQTAFSRSLLAVPIFIPSMVMIAMERARILPKSVVPLTTLQMTLFFAQLYIAVPFSVAIFSQTGTIQASELEPEYQGLKDSQSKLIKEFRFNKGL